MLSLLVSVPLPRQATVDETDSCVVQEDAVSIYDSATSLRHKLASINSKLRKYGGGGPADTKVDDVTDDVDNQPTIDFINVEMHFTWKSKCFNSLPLSFSSSSFCD